MKAFETWDKNNYYSELTEKRELPREQRKKAWKACLEYLRSKADSYVIPGSWGEQIVAVPVSVIDEELSES